MNKKQRDQITPGLDREFIEEAIKFYRKLGLNFWQMRKIILWLTSGLAKKQINYFLKLKIKGEEL